jgi:hypothetical protein
MGPLDRISTVVKRETSWRRLYGGPVWSLPVLIGCLVVTGYIADKVISGPKAFRILVWFAAAAVLHDFLLFPTYSLIDRATVAVGRKFGSVRRFDVNFLRVPAALSLLMLLIYLPTILGRGAGAFHAASGLGQIDIFLRWVLLSLGFFALSGALYLVRLLLFRHTNKERS